ncbi:glycosyltransferase [uncultured Maribacter sp.]|uniref:glycosyltransferase n=1 Tax=uncultured Maribacter sp. TaxID=431308 RepID=UPI00260A669E|nr:glycosyltransferase [uncultured Maribacter sp.]
MTKVVHLQTHLPSSGNAAFRLHKAMLKQNIESSMLSLSTDVSINSKIQSLQLRAYLNSILHEKLHQRRIKGLNSKYGMFSYPILGNNIIEHPLVKTADIIYLHWILAGFLNLKNVEDLAKTGKPIIFFMHDMWTMTGGCHHSFNCENYLSNCHSCQMFPENKNKLPNKLYNKKQNIFNKYSNLSFISPSSWLDQLAKKSSLLKNKPTYHIPNIIGKHPFKPLDKKMARKMFNLEENETIIVFGAASPKSPYKGWSYLKDALDLLKNQANTENYSIAIFGSEYDAEIAEAIPFKTYFLGRLKDEYSTALVYNAADIFVAPSIAESFGMVILEAQRCGTPVVAFKTGGIPDLIDHTKNGYLAEYKNSGDLASGISYCLNNNVKGYALPCFDPIAIVEQHKKLFQKINV